MYAELEQEIGKHFIDAFPNEAVVFIKDNKVLPQKNIHLDPEHSFLVDGWSFIEIQPDAIVHSHPNGEITPSEADYLLAQNMAVPFGIFAINKKEIKEVKWL